MLVRDPTVQCYNSTWYLLLAPAVAAAVGYIFGLPLWLFYQIRTRRRDLTDPRVLRTVGILYVTYKPHHKYHELWVMMFKMLLWGIAVFLGRGCLAQLTVAALIIAAAICVQVIMWPYADNQKNRLHAVAYVVALVSCVGGLALRLSDSNRPMCHNWETDAVMGMLDALIIACTFAIAVWMVLYKLGKFQSSDVGVRLQQAVRGRATSLARKVRRGTTLGPEQEQTEMSGNVNPLFIRNKDSGTPDASSL